MSFSRGRRPTLEYERPKSAVPTRSVVDPRLVLKLPPPAPKPAPIIAHGLRTFGGIRREPPGASAAPGASPWGTPDLPDHPRPFSAVPRTRRARPPPVGGTDKSRGVRDEYRRLRFTLRNRAGPGVDGLERCLAAFAAYDPHRLGVIAVVHFARALKNAMDVNLSQAQSACVAKDCGAESPKHPSVITGFQRVDYCAFLKRCFPSESLELGVMSSEDRMAVATAVHRPLNGTNNQPSSGFLSANTSAVSSVALQEEGGYETTTRDGTFFDQASETDLAEEPSPSGSDGSARDAYAAAAHHGTIAGVRNLNVSHEVAYPTRRGPGHLGGNAFRKRTSDVTKRTLQGEATRRIPEENQREPPLSLFHGARAPARKPPGLADTNAPKHEAAMASVRDKLRERFGVFARTEGSGVHALRKTLLAPFPAVPKKTHFDFREFRRAMAAVNVNFRKTHQRSLFDAHCDVNSQLLCVDSFCDHVVNGDGGAGCDYEGGAPLVAEFGNENETYFLQNLSDSETSTPSPAGRGKRPTDITQLGHLNGTPLRSMLPERTRGEPLNVYNHDTFSPLKDTYGRVFGSATNRALLAAKQPNNKFDADSGEARGMRTLRLRLTQRLQAKDGDGLFFMKRWLTFAVGDRFASLDENEFTKALHAMGLNQPAERTALFAAFGATTGYVDVKTFCAAVVEYEVK